MHTYRTPQTSNKIVIETDMSKMVCNYILIDRFDLFEICIVLPEFTHIKITSQPASQPTEEFNLRSNVQLNSIVKKE